MKHEKERERWKRGKIRDRQKEEIDLCVASNVYSSNVFITKVYTCIGRFLEFECLCIKQSAECACL